MLFFNLNNNKVFIYLEIIEIKIEIRYKISFK